MQIQQMFAKDINRYINGVVDVSEDNAIRQELEEYVVTRELQRHFDDFFEAYPEGSWGTSHETVELSETTFSESIWCHN